MSTQSPPYKFAKLDHPAQPAYSPAPTPAPLPQMSATGPRKRLGLGTSTAAGKVKQLTIKPKARQSPAPTVDNSAFLQSTLTTLSRAVRAIQSRPPQPTPESLQALYGLCEAAVGAGPSTSQSLYERLKLEIERQTGQVNRSIRQAVEGSDEGFLAVWEKEARLWIEQLLLIRSVFLHLDRTWLIDQPGLLSIWDLSLDLYRHSVIQNGDLAHTLTTAIVNTINRERDGDLISRPLVNSVITLLHTFSPASHPQLYLEPLIAASHTYYRAEGARFAAELDSSAYLAQVERRLTEEAERAQLMLGIELEGTLQRVVLDEMAATHVEAIVEKDLGAMIVEERRVDLTTVYSLLSRVASVAPLRAAFLEHLKSAGLEIVLDTSADEQMVDRLVALRAKAVSLVIGCFNNDSTFIHSVSQAFEVFINKRENKPAEQMAKYLDAKLRTSRAVDDAELEKTLQEVLFLFRFTQGKDIFEAFYKRDLAKRLLLNKSASFDAERSMLNKLKDECGPGFTSKLEIMFKDIELSQDVMKAYNAAQFTKSSTVDLSVNVLSQGNWPTYPPTSVRLPDSMAHTLAKFKEFYVAKHSGRSLAWQHSLDTCAIKAAFPRGGKKELAVSLFQAVVLLLFNEVQDGGRLSLNEVVELSGLEKKETKRTLQSLACGKVRVLTKVPKGREVEEDDQFEFNTSFKDDRIKIRINQIQQKETKEENKETTERVFTDRASHLQLAIVRIMKARKTILYSELVMEVITQIGSRFKVEPAEIKKSIGSLIDREYMRRAEDKPNVFHYVA